MANPVEMDIGVSQEKWSSTEMQNIQKQVNEVADIMRTNAENIMIREDRLNELDKRANDLQQSAQAFQTTSVRVKRKYWWQNLKMMLIIGGVTTLVIVIIIVAAVGIPSSD